MSLIAEYFGKSNKHDSGLIEKKAKLYSIHSKDNFRSIRNLCNR